MNPGIGKQIINDTFSNAKLWDTVNSELASATIKNKRLTLAVEPGVSIASLRRDVTLDNFSLRSLPASASAARTITTASSSVPLEFRSIASSYPVTV